MEASVDVEEFISAVLAYQQTRQNASNSQAINEFGMNVLNAITASNDGNHIISPLSLSTAMGMVHLGAKGETNTELRQVLCYNKYNITDSEAHKAYNNLLQQISGPYCCELCQYVLMFANLVMAQNDFDILTNYSNQLHINYDASIQSVDFAKNGQNAINTVNQWVTDKTCGKIRSLLGAPLPALTRLVIVSAVYFKVKWLHEFRKQSTNNDTFINNGNTKVIVQMMHKFNTHYNYTDSKELDADILEMRYIAGDISMYIILPHTVNGLRKTTSNLTEQKLNSAIKSMSTFAFNLHLPKFKMQVSYTLVDKLKSVGLNNIFTENADLSGINGHRDLFVSDVVHKVFIDVNEEGTEVIATTAGYMIPTRSTGPPPQPREFKVDHPFIFVIRDKKNDVNMFYGQITQL